MKILNMVLVIIESVIAVVFLTLGIIFQSIKGNILTIVLTSITLVVMIGYFVIKAIYYGINDSISKRVMKRIWEGLGIFSSLLVLINIILNLSFIIKWWLFGIACLLGIILLVFNSLKILERVRLILCSILLCIFLGCGFVLFGNDILFYVLGGFTIGYFIISFVDNSVVDAFEIIPLVLLGIFLIFI